MNREMITEILTKRLEPLDFIYAFWFEGADANGSVDEYSDIDYCLDVEDSHEEEAFKIVEETLSEIGKIDYKYVQDHGHPKLRQRIYHIEGTPEFLMIDFNLQLHSRDKEEYTFIEGDSIEATRVIFDKDNIVRYKTLDSTEYDQHNKDRLAESKFRYTQHSRVIKYVYRNQYPEAYIYYNKYVVEPLVNLLRLIYTPEHADFHMVHISSHIPKEMTKKLESFIMLNSIKAIKENIPKAQTWFEELLSELK